MDLTQLRLKGEGEKEFEIGKILSGEIDPLWFASVRNWRDDVFMNCGDPQDYELKLRAIDSIMDAHGVETLVEDGKAIASYVNTGDTYTPTVLYDHKDQEFLITSWGDFYEEWQAENFIDIDRKAIANFIQNISRSRHIPWEEWVEGSRDEYDSEEDYLADAAIDIRLQVMEDGWAIHYGLSDFDQDHRGAWGSSSVGKCVSMEKAMEIAKDLIEQAAESADCNLTKIIKVYNDDN